jgi:hypothetical protein
VERIYIKPAPGVKVRDPEHAQMAHLPDEGKWVNANTYWTRRLMDGDVIEAKPPRAAAESKKGE